MKNEEQNDPVWNLLENASEQKASPMFSRDVMRSIRLEAQETTPWWEKLLSPAPVFGTLATAAACVAFIVFSENPETNTPIPVVAEQSISTEQGVAILAETVSSEDDFSDLLDPLSLMASNDVDLLSDFEMLMEL
jgi:hypothetical protein